ncbi:hypothetical protein Tdes44962_MAKER01881 [Teratosphaeria destructans]|uniref:Uncharacterized protein n=1 Tax=Teratosphaeria destructans TaxID=418781 RepID=A0A9W7SWD0_9PEZI|nr:hypothetical protein Tdes44962_MAKER01881 [Teratosphaeria destructans]
MSGPELFLAAYGQSIAQSRRCATQRDRIAELEASNVELQTQLAATKTREDNTRHEASKWLNVYPSSLEYSTLGTKVEDERRQMYGTKDALAKVQRRFNEMKRKYENQIQYEATTGRQVMGLSVIIDHLSSQVGQRDRTIEKAQDKNVKQRKELDVSRKKQVDLELSNADQQRLIKRLRDNKNVVTNQKRELEHEFDVAYKKSDDRIRRLREDVEEKGRQLTVQHQKYKQLRATNSTVNDDLVKLAGENAHLKGQASNDEGEISRLLAVNEELQSKLTRSGCELESQSNTIDILRGRLKRSAYESDKLGEEIARANAIIRSLELQAKATSKKISNLEDTFESAKAEPALLRRTEDALVMERANSAKMSEDLDLLQRQAHMLQDELTTSRGWTSNFIATIQAQQLQAQQETAELLQQRPVDRASDVVETQSTQDHKASSSLPSPLTPVLKHQVTLGSRAEVLKPSVLMQAVVDASAATTGERQSASHDLPCSSTPVVSRDPRLARRRASLAVSGMKRPHDSRSDEIATAQPAKKVVHD